jgi:outer membrane protein
LQTSKWGKQSNDEFKVSGEKIKQEVDGKARAFKTAREEFEKKREVMDEKARNKRQKELQDMQSEGEKLIMESNAKLSKLSQELSAPLVEKIIEIVKRIGKDDKYDYIFERDKGGIVYANEKEDLTDRIISELDKVTPRK